MTTSNNVLTGKVIENELHVTFYFKVGQVLLQIDFIEMLSTIIAKIQNLPEGFKKYKTNMTPKKTILSNQNLIKNQNFDKNTFMV